MAVWISSFKFGSITIGGKKYEHDIIVTWEGKVKAAHVETRHVIGERELAQLILERPEIIVIGIGQSALMKISPEVAKFADEKKLKIIEKPTPLAVKEFNELVSAGKKVVAYMHITC